MYKKLLFFSLPRFLWLYYKDFDKALQQSSFDNSGGPVLHQSYKIFCIG